jgi:Sec-independent protein translocase protein TatA
MPSILFISLIAFLVVGPRKLPEIATQALRAREPWERLMKQLTQSLSGHSLGSDSDSISTSSAGQPKPTATPAELPSSLAKSAGGD